MAFHGWPAEALDFYEGLAADNSKTYWTARQEVYHTQILGPTMELLAELEPEFGPGKVFRPYRDVRFSADKAPYKTYLAARLPAAGYLQLSADGLSAGSGLHQMTSQQITRYRHAVADDRTGAELVAVIAVVERAGIEVHGRDSLTSVPRGYPGDHPRRDLLRHKGLIAWREWKPAAWLGTAAAKGRIAEFFRAARPLREWLDTNVGPFQTAR